MAQDDVIKEIANALEEAAQARAMEKANHGLYEVTGCCIITIGDGGTRKGGLTEKKCQEITDRYKDRGARCRFLPGDC